MHHPSAMVVGLTTLTMQHAFDCKVGGLVIPQRHNEISGDIAAQDRGARI